MLLNFIEILYFLGGFALIIGAFAKSAQIGLHVWLVDAMEGPTPVSALIHAATMVTAGVFLLLRIDVFFSSINYIDLYLFIGLTGGITSLLSGIAAIMQTDIKKLVAYSTVSQIGYMFIAIGAFFPEGALYHLTTHAFFKALLFLCSGVIIYYLGDEQDLRKMGGLFYFFQGTVYAIFIANLALMGFPFLSGFYSKDLILEGILSNNSFSYSILYFLAIFSAFLTIIYSLKLYLFVFFLEYKGSPVKLKMVSESVVYIFVLVSLSLLSLFSGFLFKEVFSIKSFYKYETEFLIHNIYKLIPIFLFFFGIILIKLRLFFIVKDDNWLFSNLILKNQKKFNKKLGEYTLFKIFWFDLYINKLTYSILIFSNKTLYKILEKGILETYGPRNFVQVFYFFSILSFFSLNEKIKYTNSIYIYFLVVFFIFYLKQYLLAFFLAVQFYSIVRIYNFSFFFNHQ